MLADGIIPQDLWDSVHAILKESPRARGAKNRVGTYALLKGIIFTANGTAMTPTFTRKGERLYHYYVSMDTLRNRERPEGAGPARLPAAMVEGAVVAEMRRMITSQEIATRVLEACRHSGDGVDERAVIEALRRFDGLWTSLYPAEQARIVRLLIDRVTVSSQGLAVDLRNNGIAALARDLHVGIDMEIAQ